MKGMATGYINLIIMNVRKPIRWVLCCLALLVAAHAIAHSVPKEHQDIKKVYWGSLDQFEKPGEVDLGVVIQETQEYKKIKKDKIARGTGEYWILMERSSKRALHAVSGFAEKSDYDLITVAGYLGGLEPPVETADVTKEVIKYMAENT